MQTITAQRHSRIKEGVRKEEVFRRVQISSGVDEPRRKGATQTKKVQELGGHRVMGPGQFKGLKYG